MSFKSIVGYTLLGAAAYGVGFINGTRYEINFIDNEDGKKTCKLVKRRNLKDICGECAENVLGILDDTTECDDEDYSCYEHTQLDYDNLLDDDYPADEAIVDISTEAADNFVKKQLTDAGFSDDQTDEVIDIIKGIGLL